MQDSDGEKVIASRFVSANGTPHFESGLALIEMPHVSEYLLARLIGKTAAA